MRIKNVRYERLFALEGYENRKVCLEASPSQEFSLAKSILVLDKMSKDMHIAIEAIDAAEKVYQNAISRLKVPEIEQRIKADERKHAQIESKIDVERSADNVRIVIDKLVTDAEAVNTDIMESKLALDTAIRERDNLKDELKGITRAIEGRLDLKLISLGVTR